MISYICSSELIVVVSSRLLCGLNPVFLFPYRQRVVYYLRKSICVVVQVFIGRTFWPKVFLYDTKCILRLPSGRARSCRIEGKYSCFQLHAVSLLLFGRTENWLVMMPTFSAPLVAIMATCGATSNTWWRHQMETFSALLALCAGNSPVPVNSPHEGQWRGALMFSLIYVWINYGVKQPWGWWFETRRTKLASRPSEYDNSRFLVSHTTNHRHRKSDILRVPSYTNFRWMPLFQWCGG